jgi:hypothetical protein
MLKRRGGLHLSEAKAANDALEAAGRTVDRHGDALANGGEYNRRHNAVVTATATMVRAGAVGPVVQGDKERPELTDMFNHGHVVDLAEIDGDPDGRGDVLYEVKVPASLKAQYSAGNGSAAGGQPATVGHLYAFGSTLEHYTRMVFGAKQRGAPGDPPLDHSTGQGYVATHRGHYHDALYVKRNVVVLLLVEALGGIAPAARAHIGKLARRSQGAQGAVDRTQYGDTRISTKSFYVHHAQMLSKAAVMNDARAIRRRITVLKQTAHDLAAGAAASVGQA